jgi:hypothetical protein
MNKIALCSNEQVIELICGQVRSKMLLVRNITLIGSFISFVATLGYQAFLEKQFLVSPDIPDATTGQIFPQMVKGHIFYVTGLQQQISGWLFYVQMAALSLMLIASYYYTTEK